MLKKYKAAILLLGLFLIFSVSIRTEANNKKVVKYSGFTEEELSKSLEKLTDDELINEMDEIVNELNLSDANSEIIPFANALVERKDKLNDKDIIDKIKNPELKAETKAILIDVINSKESYLNNKDTQKLLKDILKDNVDGDIKNKIISISKFDINDIDLLKEFIDNGGETAFHALNALGKVDIAQAYEISRDIISNKKNKSSEEIKGAILNSCKYFKENNKNNKNNIGKNVSEEEKKLYEELIYIFNESDDKNIKDASIFSMSDTRSPIAIKEILNQKNIDKDVRLFAIDQNYMILEEILKNNPSEDDIYMVISAMKELPINNLKDEFDNILSNISNDKLKKEINNVIDIINLQGRDGNEKWLDY